VSPPDNDGDPRNTDGLCYAHIGGRETYAGGVDVTHGLPQRHGIKSDAELAAMVDACYRFSSTPKPECRRRTKVKMNLLGIGMLLALLSLAGCSSEAPGTTAPGSEQGATTAAATDSTTTTAAAPAKISLPEGWAMEDAISAEEVGAITGETMTLFPEASSSAKSGKPVAGYLVSGKDGSKIRFSADVQGGEDLFESMRQFAEEDSIREVNGLGDKAYVCVFSPTDHGIVVLKGDLVIRVDWNPSVYSADPEEFGNRLAGKLLANLYR
jgi:hypothetical protein